MSKFILTAQLKLQAPTNTRQVLNQIQSQLKGVNINVDLKGSAQAQKAIQNINKSAQNLANTGDRVQRSFKSAFKQFLAFTVASRSISLLTNGLANATQEALEFQKELIKIQQVARVSDQTIRQLRDTIFVGDKFVSDNPSFVI